MAENGIGARTLRVEDQRFLTGQGNYLDDIVRPGQNYAYFLRSPHAHATLNSVDTSAAASAPGVVAVLTGEDVAAAGLGGVPCGFAPAGATVMNEPPRPLIAQGKVRFAGEIVAMVIASSPAEAKDASEKVSVDYGVLDASASTGTAHKEGAPQVHDEAANNTCFEWAIGDKDATDAAFAAATRVVSIDLVNNRKAPNALEPRTAIGEYDAGTGNYTLHTTTQNPHVTRLLMGAFVLQIPEHKLRVVAPDVGGGFGSKIAHYPEEALVTWAGKVTGNPVKWTSERAEAMLSDTHGRDHVTHAEMAMDDDGKFLGFRVDTQANLGAYLSTFGPLVPSYLYGTLLSGQYAIPAIHGSVRAVFTHTTPLDAERGAGRPEATYLVESIVEKAARESGIDRAEIRRRNFVPADAFPYETPVALTYDSGDYAKVLDEALKLADYDGFGARRAESEGRGKLRGLGFSSYIEACGLAPSNVAGAIGARAGLYEAAEVRMHPTGSVTVFTGSHSHGQGHETTFAQVVVEKLGVPFESIEVVHGDTDRVPFGMGTYGSRSLAVGGSAIVKSIDKIVEKGKKVAAHLLEASESDISFADGTFSVAGTDKSVSIGEVAFAAYVPHNYPLEELEPGMDETSFYDPANFVYPAGCHICEVEIDPDTGVTNIVKWSAIDDFGNIVNPMIVEGQIHGGVSHGVGQALLEEVSYDADGQLLAGTFMDYAMPRADDVPTPALGFTTTPCPHNPLGVKGCGEAGAIAEPPAVMNAVTDALQDYDTSGISMPATSEKVWRAINGGRAAAAE